MDIVNIVASGDIGRELDIETLSTELGTYETEYNPETFPGLLIRFKEDGPVVIVFESGSYTMMGVNKRQDIYKLYDRFANKLLDLGIEFPIEESRPTVQNLICKGQLGKEVNIDTLTIRLGLENIEYEPEQSPFIYYWPNEYDCLITIPANGKIMITGIRKIGTAEKAFQHLRELADSTSQN